MKHVTLLGKTRNSSDLFSLLYPFFSVAMLCVAGSAVASPILRSMFSCQAQGLGGITPTLVVSYQQGTNLSFIPSGETIKKVWLNDPSQVTMDFDGPMCMQFGQESNLNTGDCKTSAASVIQLRRIPKLKIAGIPSTNNTLLTVITEGQGQNKLYTFKVVYEENAPEYHTLAIYADPPSAKGATCVRDPQ